MNSRLIRAALLGTLLTACTAQTEPATTSTTAPAATATPTDDAPPPMQATAVATEEDPSVWDNEGEPEGETPGDELTCHDNPLATQFFTLVGGNTVDDCGRKDPKVLAAFDVLMKEAASAESTDPQTPPLRQRLLSGPSAPGQPLMLDDGAWWFYSACQAHQCGSTHLSMLYSPTQEKLVGRLVSECKLVWLGQPNAAQQELIQATDPFDASELRPGTGYCD